MPMVSGIGSSASSRLQSTHRHFEVEVNRLVVHNPMSMRMINCKELYFIYRVGKAVLCFHSITLNPIINIIPK